ncbi:MAG: SMP-30/gluconolactonase/LRE family protein, partial [Albidovulum sp.]|nr:SMP-30/gluconolactonase/LRE family protein [Albidovulum sp.]
YPEGMIDGSESGLWSAHWDGGCVSRFLPDRSDDFRVETPTRRPTALASRGRRLALASARLKYPREAGIPEREEALLHAARLLPIRRARPGNTALKPLMSLI